MDLIARLRALLSMSRFRILPYKMNSLSSRAISRHFGVLRIRKEGDFVPRNGDKIINWGTGGYVPVLHRNNAQFELLNSPEAIDRATSKISTLRLLKQNNVPSVEFSLSREGAEQFINDGHLVYCRTLIQSKAGKGIVLANTVEELPDNCKLFTKKFQNDEEYRVHVFNGEVIDRVHKKKMSKERMQKMGVTEADLCSDIKNLKKGWSFCREGLVVHEGLDDVAINAVNALGLDFGAVDLARNQETGAIVVLEVNTAAGQKRGTTTHHRYVDAISKWVYNRGVSIEEYNQKYNCNLEFGLLDGEEEQQPVQAHEGDNDDIED